MRTHAEMYAMSAVAATISASSMSHSMNGAPRVDLQNSSAASVFVMGRL